jgi:ribosomal protein L37AE/L43A
MGKISTFRETVGRENGRFGVREGEALDLKVLNKPPEKRDEMVCPSNIPWYCLLQKVVGKSC